MEDNIKEDLLKTIDIKKDKHATIKYYKTLEIGYHKYELCITYVKRKYMLSESHSLQISKIAGMLKEEIRTYFFNTELSNEELFNEIEKAVKETEDDIIEEVSNIEEVTLFMNKLGFK